MNKILYIFFIILVTTSFSIKPIDKYHGVAFLEKKQKELSINESNKNDIIKILGAPSTQSILEDDLWIYIENRKSKSSILKLGKEIVLTNNVLVLEFNNRGMLVKKELLKIDKMNNLKISDNKTAVNNKKDSFVSNFLTSLIRKIDDPLGKKKAK